MDKHTRSMHQSNQKKHLLNKTPMRLILICTVLISLTNVSSKAQTIADSEFQWKKYEDCIPKGTSKNIFIKVEEDPIFTQFSKAEFDKLIANVIKELNLAENINGIIKLKILFAKGQSLCVTQVGTKSLELCDSEVNKIKEIISRINDFKYGRQRNIEVDCLGLLYIDLTNGKVVKTRNVNFKFG